MFFDCCHHEWPLDWTENEPPPLRLTSVPGLGGWFGPLLRAHMQAARPLAPGGTRPSPHAHRDFQEHHEKQVTHAAWDARCKRDHLGQSL